MYTLRKDAELPVALSVCSVFRSDPPIIWILDRRVLLVDRLLATGLPEEVESQPLGRQ
jgi:hypothetical protein